MTDVGQMRRFRPHQFVLAVLLRRPNRADVFAVVVAVRKPTVSRMRALIDRVHRRRMSPASTQQETDLAPELLSRGAVEEEVARVVGVHQQLRDGADQFELGRARDVELALVPEAGGDQHDVHGQRHREEREGYAQEHHRQSRAALAAAAAPRAAARRVDLARGRMRQAPSLRERREHAPYDAHVEEHDDDERQEGVDGGVDPRPHEHDQRLVSRRAVALLYRFAAVLVEPDLRRPEEVQIEREHQAEEEQHHLRGEDM